MTGSVQWTVVIALAAFLIFLAAVGVLAKRMVRSDEDFICGGRSVGPVFTAISFCVAYYSSAGVIGGPAMHYLYGLGYTSFNFIANTWFAGIAVFLFLALRMRVVSERVGAVSMSGFLARRFESETLRCICAVVVALFTIPYGVACLKAVGNSLEIIAGVPYIAVIIAISIAALVYMVVSGYWGVIWTDMIQGIVMSVAMLGTAYIVYSNFDGLGDMVSHLKASNPEFLELPGPLPWGMMFSYAFVWGLVVFGQPQLVTKFIALKDAKSVGLTLVVSTAWMTLFLMSCAMIGIGGRLMFGDSYASNPDFVCPAVALKGSKFLAVLFVCGVVSAGLTSLAALVMTAATSISRDFYEDFWCRKNGVTPSNTLRLHRICVGVIIVLTFALSIRPWDFVWQLSTAGAGCLASSFTAPLLIGLYWKRATKAGAIVSVICGAAVCLAWYVFKLGWFHPYVPGMTASIAAFVIVSLATKPPSEETISLVFPKI